MEKYELHQAPDHNSPTVLTKLWRGDLGLAKSYWLWGIAVCSILGIALNLINPAPGTLPARILMLIIMAYVAFVSIGIWRASDRYQGSRVWWALARLGVVINWFCVGAFSLAILFVVFD